MRRVESWFNRWSSKHCDEVMRARYEKQKLWEKTRKAWVRLSYMNEDKFYKACGEIGTLKTKLAAAEARIALLENVREAAELVRTCGQGVGFLNLHKALKACEGPERGEPDDGGSPELEKHR